MNFCEVKMQAILERKGFQKDFRQRNEHGLSLLEIVIAVAIIAIFAVVGIIGFQQLTDNARQAAVESAAQTLHTAGTADKVFGEEDLNALADDWTSRSEGMTASITDAGNDICVVVKNDRHGQVGTRGACDGIDTGDENTGGDNAGDENNAGEDILAAQVLIDFVLHFEGYAALATSYIDADISINGSVEDLMNNNGTVEIVNIEISSPHFYPVLEGKEDVIEQELMNYLETSDLMEVIGAAITEGGADVDLTDQVSDAFADLDVFTINGVDIELYEVYMGHFEVEL